MPCHPTPENRRLCRKGIIRLTINGDEYRIQVQPEWTLNYLIHDKLGLTSPKMFCDRGACGSCTVIMNGRPILSLHDPGHRMRRQQG
jgi:aerobic-type carbon monoxide dehydrogenase small subunit (CoxS/CutS family)